MASTKTRFVENETLLQVTVHTPVMWGDLKPQMHVVSYPNGRTYALSEDLLNLHFTIVRPQEISLTAHGADGTDRPTPNQVQVEHGARYEPTLDIQEVMIEPPAEDALTRARRLYAPSPEPVPRD